MAFTTFFKHKYATTVDAVREMGKFSAFRLIFTCRPHSVIPRLKEMKRLEDEKKDIKQPSNTKRKQV